MGKTVKCILGLSLITLLIISCDDLLDDPVETDVRSRLEGVWSVEEDSQLFSKTNYLAEISKHPWDSNRIYIDNIYNVDSYAEAIVSGRILTIPEQVMEGGFRIYGTGTISKDFDLINWEYTVDDGSSQLDNATAVYTPF
jgi:hypothetical protein